MKRLHSSQDSPPQNEASTVDSQTTSSKRTKSIKSAGIVHKISLENFLCHDKLEMQFNQQINFIIGKNGSGKSAVLTGIVVALGEKAKATSRGKSIKDFVKTGKPKAVVRVTLLNQGQSSYKRDTYGDYITIERTIMSSTGAGGYRILNEQGRVVSTKRSDLDRILTKMNLQVDNPVCILNQETAKNFLHSNDAHQKYKLFERATQMDVMREEFSVAEDELSRSKSCMKEKAQSLELLKADVLKWHTKKEWYEAINEVHEKKAKLENEIAWAQVEDYEKKASQALIVKEKQTEEIQRTRKRIEEQENRLAALKNNVQSHDDEVNEKSREIIRAREELAKVDTQEKDIKNRLRELLSELRQYDTEKRRLENDKQELVNEIDKLKKAHGDSEFAQRKERRIRELNALKTREETLNSLRKVSDHQVEQLKGALVQLKNEAQATRSEHARIQRNLEPKMRTLNELQKADSNAYAVFGSWVPILLQKIERTSFRGAKPRGPFGAYIKLKDSSWAPVVEKFFGNRLSNFICSNDEDAKLLNRMLDETVPKGRPKPQIITSSMNGQIHNVSDYKVYCSSELQNKDIHCLMDLLIIDDPDVANILIDLTSIEQILCIGDDRDARYLLADASRVPQNCKSAITKEGNTYFPDPNYRSYAGKASKTATLLQASVEDAIRNLEDEINIMRREEEGARKKAMQLNSQVQNNETELRSEESKLQSTRKELMSVCEKIRSLESENEPEPTDVLALEEDLLDVEQKLEKNQQEQQVKSATCEELKRELHKVRQACAEHTKIISKLMSDSEPLKDAVEHAKNKQREISEGIERITSSLASMQSKLKGFEADYETAKQKAESEAAAAALLSTRVPVTKSLKNLHSELRQIKEQVAAQEKEYGSREYVLSEYRRRKTDYDRANFEVKNSQRSLKKMTEMAKQRKIFISQFRSSIEMRTHHVFQSLLKTRNFEGEIQIDSNEKSLVLLVTPPGREELASQPTSKRSRTNGVTDIRSLSGGERSFATVCFILSLWDAIESPFRILDEFDVFMDHVNRSISMDLLIHEARENSGHQFIFLTPLGLEKQQLRSVDDLSIFKMNDPDRNDGETEAS